MTKFHHKLYILNKFLSKSINLLSKLTKDKKVIIKAMTIILGCSLENYKVAPKLAKKLKKDIPFYLKHPKKYPMNIAIMVSKHKLINDKMYPRLKRSYKNLDTITKTVYEVVQSKKHYNN